MGDVRSGSWLGVPVAVKTFKGNADSPQKQLTEEAAMLAKLRHPFICQFFGTCEIDGRLTVVMELLERSLHDVIHGSSSKPSVPLTYRLAHEIAQGIAYLHRNTVMHRDIKPPNVMLDGAGHAKVCDFGLSRTVMFNFVPEEHMRRTDSSLHSTVGVGTLRYVAPEVLKPLSRAGGDEIKVYYTYACDVYSFGLLLWEFCHGEFPFSEYSGVEVATSVAPSGRRPTLQLPEEFEALGALIVLCWDQDPARRPTMSGCAELLQVAQQKAARQGPSDNSIGPSDLVPSLVSSSNDGVDSSLSLWGSTPPLARDGKSAKISPV